MVFEITKSCNLLCVCYYPSCVEVTVEVVFGITLSVEVIMEVVFGIPLSVEVILVGLALYLSL